ncbi:MAG: LON peptidase substrate-binding domain-containing protein [Shewanella sp.]
MKLPLFPLPICLLPEGFTQLRIFEPRYKRLVAESLKSAQGFGLCMLEQQSNLIQPIGTLAHIIDFETLADGMLGILVQGIQRFELKQFVSESDGLKYGEVTLLDNWPRAPITPNDRYLSDMLHTIFSRYPKHLQHYQKQQFNDIAWVCQRWLEILPIAPTDKYACINTQDHLIARDFLRAILNKP